MLIRFYYTITNILDRDLEFSALFFFENMAWALPIYCRVIQHLVDCIRLFGYANGLVSIDAPFLLSC